MLAHWFVVANQDFAKILVDDGEHQELQTLHTLQKPRTPEREPNLIPNQTHHDIAAAIFAKEIAAFLQRELLAKNFIFLTIAAEPKFLGKLRKELSSQLLKSVTKWIRKDFQKTPIHDLPELLGIELQFNKELKKRQSVFSQAQQPPHK